MTRGGHTEPRHLSKLQLDARHQCWLLRLDPPVDGLFSLKYYLYLTAFKLLSRTETAMI